jgi:3-hydroxybutyryl-CoA dehydrogenase
MDINKVGIVGCGLMGAGIAQVVATAGYETVVSEVSQERISKGLTGIEKNLARAIEKGALAAEQRSQILGRLTGTTRLEGLKDCDLVIEAITENLEAKILVLRQLDMACKAETIFVSNTSSLSIAQLMTATRRPSRFLGLHFFNPVPVMKLVEVVRTLATDPAVYEATLEFVKSLGKTPVSARDTGGFIVNRLLIPYLIDAIRAYEEGVSSIPDIDSAMKLGCGFPMGPFTLCDFIGLDTTCSIADILFDEFREKRFAPPPLLKRLVLAGHFGKKTGRGFYDWSDPQNPQPWL